MIMREKMKVEMPLDQASNLGPMMTQEANHKIMRFLMKMELIPWLILITELKIISF